MQYQPKPGVPKNVQVLVYTAIRICEKKAYMRKSVAQIGLGILLILFHAGLTATTDSALL